MFLSLQFALNYFMTQEVSDRADFEELSRRLKLQFVSPRTLLGGMSVVDETSRLTGQYQDPNYLPFYYHMGRVFRPSRVFCIGLDLGLHLSCLLKGCPEPKSAVSLQPPSDSFYSPRLAVLNIKSAAGRKFPFFTHSGLIQDQALSASLSSGVDAVIVTREMSSDPLMEALDFCWKRLAPEGFLALDHLSHRGSEQVFLDFCKSKGAEWSFFKTRYKMGIAIK